MKNVSASLLLVSSVFVFAVAYAVGVSYAEPGSVEYVDVHTHLIAGEIPEGIGGPGPKSQQGAGVRDQQPAQRSWGERPRKTQEDYNEAAKNLVSVMDRLGIQRSVVMSPPKTAENMDNDDYEKFNYAVKLYPGRLALGAGGGSLNPIIHATDKNNVTDAVLKRFDKEASRVIESGARCFGEMAVLHISHSNVHVFEQTPADHPLFLRLADLSAQYGIPIDLHMDCVPEEMPTPMLWLNRSRKNPATLNANVAGLERLLEHNRQAKIVWQHVGRDTMNQLTPALVRGLLSKHVNLYCALWTRQPDRPAMTGPPGRNQIVDENYQVRQEWLALFQDFPDRFMVGTDAFIDSTLSKLDPAIEGTWNFVNSLSDDLKRKIGGENAKRVYGL